MRTGVILVLALCLAFVLTDIIPQPIRKDGSAGATDKGPRNIELDRQNPDQFVPPKTDRGKVPNMKYSFSNSHMRLEDGGWTREVTVRDLPISTTIAGVNMRLKAGAIRELHWHVQAEWAYMLNGNARITAVDENGRNFIDDVEEGDLWYFPSGIPHSIQGLGPDGCEFLLVFDDGDFSEDSTFLLADWIAHTPAEILAKNFDFPDDAFANTSKKELYIFQEDVPENSLEEELRENRSPQGAVKPTFSYRMLEQEPIRTAKGTVRITDSTNFKASKTIAAALVEIEPHGLRELHWHPSSDEWMYVLQGEAKLTVFAAESKARTFNFRASDVGYIPKSMGHYVENIGNSTLRFLEMFRTDKYADVSLNQWMGLTPKQLVNAHLRLKPELLDRFTKRKVPVV